MTTASNDVELVAPLPRWLWLLIAPAILLVAKTLAAFAAIVSPYLRIQYDGWFELAMVLGQILWQWLWLGRRGWHKRLEYSLLVIAVSSLGAALLLPLLAISARAAHGGCRVTAEVAAIYFFAVVGLMFVAHSWLMKRRSLPMYLSLTWVAYRIPILLFVTRWDLLF